MSETENKTNESVQYNGPINSVETQKNDQGNLCATTTVKHNSIQSCSEITCGTHLPGVIIFVHGVNSEGEWYDFAEEYLCEGLNERLGIADNDDYKLIPNKYKEEGRILRTGEFTYLDKSNRSPVIRFYWGYRSSDKDLKNYLIPLRNRQDGNFHQEMLDIRTKDKNEIKTEIENIQNRGPYFWGGGPFQNGTTNLVQLWSEFGFSDSIWGVVNPEWFNPEKDRLLTAAPPRRYYAHAAWRLAMLIQRIRDNYQDDTITIVSHSQGTMIAMAASLISAPDSLFIMNSPYRITQSFMDGFSLESVDNSTSEARVNTLANVVESVGKYHQKLKNNSDLQSRLSVGKPTEGEAWTLDKKHKGEYGDIPERDNHGRTYIYCNAHDRVMGSSPIESIGWQGLPNDQQGNPHPLLVKYEGKLFQRLLARWTLVGGKPKDDTPFGSLPDMFEDRVSIVKHYIAGGFMEQEIKSTFQLKTFWDDMEYVIAIPRIAIQHPFASYVIKDTPIWTTLVDATGYENLMPIWTTPPSWQTMSINGEEVPKAVQFNETFDEVRKDPAVTGKKEGWGEKNDGKAVDESYVYYKPLYSLYHQKYENKTVLTYSVLDKVPAGFDNSNEAQKRRSENRLKGQYGIENGWVIKSALMYKDALPSLSSPHKLMYAEKIVIKDQGSKIWFGELEAYISRPTDHSTLPQNEQFVTKVMAYDLPIGFGYSVDPAGHFKEELIRQADWTLPGSDPYMEKGILSLDADKSLLEEYFVGQTLLPTEMPSNIDSNYSLSHKDAIIQCALFIEDMLNDVKTKLEYSAELYAQSQISQGEVQLALANKQLEQINTFLISIKNGTVSMMKTIGENELKNSEMQIEQTKALIEQVNEVASKVKSSVGNVVGKIGEAEIKRAEMENQQAQAMINMIKAFFN